MKRSEMVKLVKGLFDIAPKYPNDMNAENLVSWLEYKGMLPPAYSRVAPGPHEYHDEIPRITVNQWEPETE